MVLDLEMALVSILIAPMIAVTAPTNPTCTVDRVLTLRQNEYLPKNKLKVIL